MSHLKQSYSYHEVYNLTSIRGSEHMKQEIQCDFRLTNQMSSVRSISFSKSGNAAALSAAPLCFPLTKIFYSEHKEPVWSPAEEHLVLITFTLLNGL